MMISILGMYEYDSTVFDGFIVPDGVDRQSVIDNILLQCAELELVYSTPFTMKHAIKTWSESSKIAWEKLYKTLSIEYNPIWNVDADVVINRDTSGDSESVDAVQGFNSSNWADASKNNSDYTGAEKIVERRTGNIGVTASQDLIKKEREVADFSIIDFITNSFKKRFCIMIY